MSCEEVVELYVSSKNNAVKAPVRALKGFKRINRKVGESRALKFSICNSIFEKNGQAL